MTFRKFADNIVMFEKEIIKLLIQVVTSWQVIAISIGLILYLNIVFYMAKAYRRPRMGKISVKKSKKKEAAVVQDTSSESSDSNDELGLEES